MVELDANQIVELFEKNVSARKRLAELIVMEPDIRLAIIDAIIRDVATREDIEKLRIATKEGINGLDKRMTRLEGQMNLFIKLFITFNLPILLGIIGILLRLIFS
ncbi:MAG: hypothetical protein QW272_07435 [Candidatus Methanomethylicaceae archaeon]